MSLFLLLVPKEKGFYKPYYPFYKDGYGKEFP